MTKVRAITNTSHYGRHVLLHALNLPHRGSMAQAKGHGHFRVPVGQGQVQDQAPVAASVALAGLDHQGNAD